MSDNLIFSLLALCFLGGGIYLILSGYLWLGFFVLLLITGVRSFFSPSKPPQDGEQE